MNNNFEFYRGYYSFDIPKEILFDWLVELAWSTDYDSLPLVTFNLVSDSEDSFFNVLDSENDHKTSLAEAIKRAYFKMKDSQKEERRKQYEELKKEFQ